MAEMAVMGERRTESGRGRAQLGMLKYIGTRYCKGKGVKGA